MSFEPRETFLWPLAAFSLHVKLTDLLITTVPQALKAHVSGEFR